jgi:excisionase family DNA binding protein
MAELPDVRFLTVAEVAEIMRVSKMTVYRLVHSGELPAVRFGRSYRVPETAVTEACNGRSPTSARLFRGHFSMPVPGRGDPRPDP